MTICGATYSLTLIVGAVGICSFLCWLWGYYAGRFDALAKRSVP